MLLPRIGKRSRAPWRARALPGAVCCTPIFPRSTLPIRSSSASRSGFLISAGSEENEIVGNVFEDVAGYAVVLEGDLNRMRPARVYELAGRSWKPMMRKWSSPVITSRILRSRIRAKLVQSVNEKV